MRPEDIDSIERVKLDRMQADFRQAEEKAAKLGLVLHRISKRRYEVLKVQAVPAGSYAYWLSEPAFGPAAEQECKDFITKLAAEKSATT